MASEPFPSLHLLTIQAMVPLSWDFEELRAPYWRLYWNADPGAYVRSGGTRHALEPEQILLIPPETSFGTERLRPARHFYVHFLTNPGWLRPSIEFVKTGRDLRQRLRAMFDGPPDPWEVAALVCECLRRLDRSGWRRAGLHGESIRRALEHLESALPLGVPVPELAAKAGMDLNRFIRIFREETGRTPGAYARERRLAAACVFLHHSDHTIERIAELCGFCDRHHFTRAFAAARGISPAAFRRQSAAPLRGLR